MARSTDQTPPLPHIPAMDPAEFEQTWQDAPRLLAALNGAARVLGLPAATGHVADALQGWVPRWAQTWPT